MSLVLNTNKRILKSGNGAFINAIASTPAPVIPNLVSHYKFNDNAGDTIVEDNTATNNDGWAVQNTSVIHADSGNPPNLNGSFTFNGSTDYINMNASGIFPVNDFTINMWVMTTSDNQLNQIPMAYIPGWGSGQGCYIHFTIPLSEGAPDHAIAIGNWATYTDCSAEYIWAKNIWYMLTVTRETTATKVYLNTNLVVTRNNPIEMGTPTYLNIGGGWTGGGVGYPWIGNIDDVRIYDKVLSSGQIATLYNGGTGTENEPF